MQPFVAALVGSALGLIGSRYLFVNSWLSLIPWTIAGLILGWWALNRRAAAVNGAIYGFFLIYVFMFGGYQGSESLASRILPFAAIGLVGAVFGSLLLLIGSFLRRR